MAVVILLVFPAWGLVSLVGIAACVVAGRADTRTKALQGELEDQRSAAPARVVAL